MILVVGATGQLGALVVEQLVQGGQRVRCLVRAGTDDSRIRDSGAESAVGDLTEPDSLRTACQSVDTVVATATAIARRLAGARGPSIRDVDQDGMSALVSAAEAARVERFVYVSYAGVEAGLGTPIERAKLATEHQLRSSSMRSVIVRPDAFQEVHLAPLGRFDMEHRKVAVFGRGDCPRPWVSVEDVAALLAAVAVEPDPPALIEFGGPEALSRNEAIALAERLTGARMKRQRVPRVVARLGARLLVRPNDALASLFGLGLLLDQMETTWDDGPLTQRGITPRPASDFIREQARTLR